MNKSTFFLFPPTAETLPRAKELGVNSVFLANSGVNPTSVSLVRDFLGTVEIHAEIPVFAGAGLLKKFPDSKPVEATGKHAYKDWYYGLCPTHQGLRQECLESVKKALELDITCVWLDFIRYPTKWEEPEPCILDTCYCDRCLEMFEEYIGEPVTGSTLEEKVLLIDGSYYIEWLEFKALQITSMVKEVRKLIDASGKKVKLGFFAIPWEDKEHGAGIKRIVAQDFSQLAEIVDMVSPMLYHKMCGKDVAWIKGKVDYFWQFGIPFIPLIQTEPRISEVGVEEFKQALEFAGSKPSSGVCVFFLEDLVKRPELFGVVKRYFSSSCS